MMCQAQGSRNMLPTESRDDETNDCSCLDSDFCSVCDRAGRNFTNKSSYQLLSPLMPCQIYVM